MFVGSSQFNIASTFDLSIYTPSAITKCPKYSICNIPKLHFEYLAYKWLSIKPTTPTLDAWYGSPNLDCRPEYHKKI